MIGCRPRGRACAQRRRHAIPPPRAALTDCLLHVGDFGVWPDPRRVDKATRRHDGAGDFPRWFETKREAPRKTIFIKGNHEDFVWLDAQPTTDILPGLHYLRNGATFDLTDDDGVIRIGGVGGCYGPTNYERRSASLQGYSKRHYTQDEIERLAQVEGIDVVLTHDAPAGVTFPRHRQGDGWVSNARGLDVLLARARPRVCFFGHHHTRVDAEVSGVRCIGLNKVARPGNLVAFEMTAGRRDWRLLGEWP
ncbi:MAG: metallophosphoesterase [Myxococcales bacterium]|nr:metallophosphoesterase [Myxococcales bacterium]